MRAGAAPHVRLSKLSEEMKLPRSITSVAVVGGDKDIGPFRGKLLVARQADVLRVSSPAVGFL